MPHAIEIRGYNLKPGSRDAFHRLMTGQVLALLQRWGVGVISCGPSPHDSDSFCLIRCYRDVAKRQARQDAFYGSDEWRN